MFLKDSGGGGESNVRLNRFKRNLTKKRTTTTQTGKHYFSFQGIKTITASAYVKETQTGSQEEKDRTYKTVFFRILCSAAEIVVVDHKLVMY